MRKGKILRKILAALLVCFVSTCEIANNSALVCFACACVLAHFTEAAYYTWASFSACRLLNKVLSLNL